MSVEILVWYISESVGVHFTKHDLILDTLLSRVIPRRHRYKYPSDLRSQDMTCMQLTILRYQTIWIFNPATKGYWVQLSTCGSQLWIKMEFDLSC